MNSHGEDEACILWVGNLDQNVTEELLFGMGFFIVKLLYYNYYSVL